MNQNGLGRQLGSHLVLGPTQDEGCHPTLEILLAIFIGVFLDRALKPRPKGFLAPQEPGQEEAHQGPEFP